MGTTISLPAMLKPRTLCVGALVAVLALVATACDSSGADEATTSTSESVPAESSTTTTPPPVTSIPSDSIPGSSSASIAPEVANRMRADIGVIILDVEESRGLPFLAVPTVTILDEAEFTQRVNEQLVIELDAEELDDQGIAHVTFVEDLVDLVDLVPARMVRNRPVSLLREFQLGGLTSRRDLGAEAELSLVVPHRFLVVLDLDPPKYDPDLAATGFGHAVSWLFSKSGNAEK